MVQEHDGFVIVNPSELCLSVESFVPIPDGLIGGKKPPDAPALGIRPMGVKKLASSLTLEWPQTPGSSPALTYRDINKSIPEALWSPDPTPDARTANELVAKAIPNVLMGIEVLPQESEQFPPVVHKIETHEISVPERSWQKKRTEREAFYERERSLLFHEYEGLPQDHREPAKLDEIQATREKEHGLFRDNLKRPNPEVIEAIRGAGFSNILENAVDLERLFKASDPTSVWLAAPTFVRMGKLPPAPAGA
jgi:hypothetical protein